MQNTEKIVVARPVPSRPVTRHGSVSETLAGAINSSPQHPATAAIKPKTVRLKNSVNISPSESIPSQGHYDSHRITSESGHEKTLQDEQSKHQDGNEVNYLAQSSPSIASDLNPRNREQGAKSQHPTSNGGRSSYDGYNWRKYGQKQVKGSEYPRSYYKCTHPSCSMKKKVERSLDGQIAEIVYKGEHNHPRPQPTKRLSSGSEEQNSDPMIAGSAQNGVTEDRIEVGILGTSHDLSAECDVGNRTSRTDNDRHKSKRRKNWDQVRKAGTTPERVGDSESATQTCLESHVAGDGFRWRKYGQKIVKGNSYPRSYYKCASFKCNARKHIERASDDPRSFITTYEGKHNHEICQIKE